MTVYLHGITEGVCDQRSLTEEGGLTLNVGSAIPQTGVSNWEKEESGLSPSMHFSLLPACEKRCDQLPHAPAVILLCHGGWYPKTVTTMNPFFLTLLLPATWSQQRAEERAQLPLRGCHKLLSTTGERND